MKIYSTLLFSVKEQGLETRKLQEAFCKGRRRRSSKGFKGYKRICGKVVCKGRKYYKCSSNANQVIAFIDSSSLVKKTFRRVITFRKTLPLGKCRGDANARGSEREEEEEVEEDVQRDSKVIKEYVEKLFLKVVSVQKFYEMQVKVLLLQTLHVWSRKSLEEL